MGAIAIEVANNDIGCVLFKQDGVIRGMVNVPVV